MRASLSTGADDDDDTKSLSSSLGDRIGIHPVSSCSQWCCRGPVVAAGEGQGVAVTPPAPGDTKEGPPHEQLLTGMAVVS